MIKEVRLNIQLSTQTHEIWYAGYSCGTINYSKKQFDLSSCFMGGQGGYRLNLQ